MTDASGEASLSPGAVVGFVGLGNMGSPMAGRLAERGYVVRGYDVAPEAREMLAKSTAKSTVKSTANSTAATVVETAAEAADGADAVVLMLPNSAVVHSVLFDAGLLDRVAPGTVLVDMGSSEPMQTRELAKTAGDRGVPMVDAPVSGGVRGARDGSLTIMAGGSPEAVAVVRPMLEVLGRKILHVGPAGAGHALKALNNLLSATHLLVTSEAMLAGREFGLDPAVMLEAFNGSSGRSGSTETKWPRFILDRSFDSGFGLRLMLKDMRIAVGLADATGRPSRLGQAAVELWAHAAERLPAEADHTEIVRWLEAEGERIDG